MSFVKEVTTAAAQSRLRREQMRSFHRDKKALYPTEEWTISEHAYQLDRNHHSETVFALGNGYMGVRGNFEEGAPAAAATTPGTYINGFYETWPIIYGEFAPQQPREYQTMVNVTAWLPFSVAVDGETFSLDSGTVHHYHRVLDLRRGILTREVVWENSQGSKVELHFERFVSLTEQHAALLRVRITPLTAVESIVLQSKIEGAVKNHYHMRHQPLQVSSVETQDHVGWVQSQTKNTGFALLAGMFHSTASTEDFWQPRADLQSTDTAAVWSTSFTPETGRDYTVTKYVVMATERDLPREKLQPALTDILNRSAQQGYDSLLRDHKAAWKRYWQDTDVEINGDPLLQQGLRFNAFHLFQSAGRSGRTNVAAKGLTGEYYEGHYFWDTETYIIPFFLYSRPELVRQLLLYRYSILDHARANARRMRDRGALYAWRTIDGREASGNFLGSTVQYHINADIAYAIHKYVEATGDFDFLAAYGAEMLFETARCWAHRGFFSARRQNRFCINEVCGPDEYKPGVNNNAYTNFMAQFNLERAVEAYRWLQADDPHRCKELCAKLELTEAEVDRWAECAAKMYLPFDEELQIHPQDDSFLDKDPIDVDAIPDEDIPLVGHWHPLVIWRYQIIKQADVVLLQFLLGHAFSRDQKRRDFDYYEPKTTHDSSLSPAIYSIMAAEIGRREHASSYFRQTARLDLDDYNKNAWQGVHTACMAGSWMCVVNGFAGMRTEAGRMSLRPMCPAEIEGYTFKIKFKGCQFQVEVSAEKADYTLLQGETLSLNHYDRPFALKRGEMISLPLETF